MKCLEIQRAYNHIALCSLKLDRYLWMILANISRDNNLMNFSILWYLANCVSPFYFSEYLYNIESSKIST
jgi:hypothetical protein